MLPSPEKLAAFVEFTMRPLVEDVRKIGEQLVKLNVPITEPVIYRTALAVGLWHLVSEVIRACTYLGVTWVICQTIRQLW